MKLTIGTRGSSLALTQTNLIKDLIENTFPEITIDIKIIKTTGDIKNTDPIEKIGGKEVFVKEIERELIDGDIDLAVHSMKDLPSDLPDELTIGFIPKREDYRDCLVLKEPLSIKKLKKNAKIGTGSKRRAYQMLKLRSDLEIVPIRGNVETRIKKIETENLDGVILAAAGIKRLGLSPENIIYFEKEDMIPSPAQGILAIEMRKSDRDLIEKFSVLNDKTAQIQAEVEREFLKAVGGSCIMPVGAYADVSDDDITLFGMFGREDFSKVVKGKISGRADDNLGKKLGEKLLKELKKGKVYLIGAGPGDEDLITVKGLNALRESDVVVYDRLASDILLCECKQDAEFIYVGKESKNHTLKQEEINELLFKKADEGKVVARLKGGDPYVFGRGGEEGEYLFDRGIEFEEIPGITSAIGGLAYAGIPITHRGVATSFHVITGHTRHDDELDYETLSKLDGTLVFLMGMKNLEKIVNGLLKYGKNPKTKVAVINWATTPEQRTVTGDLETIVDVVNREKVSSPSLIVVGDVVNLREKLNFFENKNMSGKNIVLFREKNKMSETYKKFKELGANVVSMPMINTSFIKSKELDSAIENIEDYEYIFFTSVNGVEYFMNYFLERRDIRALSENKFLVIGKKTYEALEKFGIRAELTPKKYEGLAAVETLRKNISDGKKVLVPRSKLGRNEVVEKLKEFSDVEEIPIYDTIPEGKEDSLKFERFEKMKDYYLVFTSSSTFDNLRRAASTDLKKIMENGTVVSIGPVTTNTIKSNGYDVDIEAREYTIDGIIEAIEEEI